LKINFLGTGTSQAVPVIGCACDVCKSDDPKDHRLRSSALIQINNQNILIDIGPDFRQQMLTAGIDDIDCVLLTHEHTDHVGGLDDIRPINFKWRKNIPMYGKKRTLDNVKRMYHYAFSENPYPGVPRIDLKPIVDRKIEFDGIAITALDILHGKMDILGYRINNFVYITDASHIPEDSMEKIKGCEVLVINALRQSDHPSHFALEEALEHINIIQPKASYITHVSHFMGSRNEIEAILPQNVYLAYDGLSIDIQ